ncbi:MULTISPECIES: flagellar FlbD family protein [Thermaerobacter]|uniref:flagellar FlbD family protein n=1 Tax=Thermaerobacter TaxID=73918 RepID=UPI0026ADFF30|nr:flagellar FlbD family protein [Thermaerobacter composti]
MVRVTRLDGRELVVNAELIELLEATPDTVITLSTGRRLVVRESVAEVVRRVVAYRRRVAVGGGRFVAAARLRRAGSGLGGAGRRGGAEGANGPPSPEPVEGSPLAPKAARGPGGAERCTRGCEDGDGA